MTTPESLALTRIAEILDRANDAASDLQGSEGETAPVNDSPEAAMMATVRAQNMLAQTHSIYLTALKEIVGLLAGDIDRLRQEIGG